MSSEALLPLLVGWGLGLLTGPISEYIRRDFRQRELRQALRDELRECRHLMATLAFRLSEHVGALDHELVEWALPIYREASVDPPNERVIAHLESLSALSPEQLDGALPNEMARGKSLTLKTNALPLLDSVLPELSLLPTPLRGRILYIREKLDQWNQDVPDLKELHRKTFDESLSPGNRAVIRGNLEEGYRALSRRARMIADRIGPVLTEL